MAAVHQLIKHHASRLHIGGDCCRALSDPHELLRSVTLTVSGETGPHGVAASRGLPWPARRTPSRMVVALSGLSRGVLCCRRRDRRSWQTER